jgi:hypothetical protein
MSENTTAITIGIVAIITALGTASAMLCKTLKKSKCMCVDIETRTPENSVSNLNANTKEKINNETSV